MRYTYLGTSLGTLLVAGDEAGLRHVRFTDRDAPAIPGWTHAPDSFEEVANDLRDYLSGRLRDFTLPIAPQGTPFQRRVWEAVRAVHYGSVATYAELASGLGMPNAARAVGRANACNPLPIVIPCHRIVGTGGRLVGYLGGLDIKRSLLRLEGVASHEPSGGVRDCSARGADDSLGGMR